MVKNLPAVQETQVPSPYRDDPVKEGMATQYSILAWRVQWTEGHGGATVHGVTESDTPEHSAHTHSGPCVAGGGVLGAVLCGSSPGQPPLSSPDPERWTNIPLLVKILKLIINELSSVMEANAARQAAPAEWNQGALRPRTLPTHCSGARLAAPREATLPGWLLLGASQPVPAPQHSRLSGRLPGGSAHPWFNKLLLFLRPHLIQMVS